MSKLFVSSVYFGKRKSVSIGKRVFNALKD